MARTKHSLSRQRRNSSRAMGRKLHRLRPLVIEMLESRVLLAAPVIVGVDPAPNSHSAPVGTNVEATFDQPMNAGTGNEDTFVVHGMQSGQLLDAPNVFNVSGSTVRLNPSATFKPGELVQVTATTGIRNQSGEAAAAPFVWQFRAGVTSGTGFFGDSGQSLGDSITKDVALGDLDGDGDLDVITVGQLADPILVWFNDGQGAFVDSGQRLADGLNFRVELGDIDGDGDLDAFFVGISNELHFLKTDSG